MGRWKRCPGVASDGSQRRSSYFIWFSYWFIKRKYSVYYYLLTIMELLLSTTFHNALWDTLSA